MSTVSGVFPNAITPSFSPVNDPAEAARLRRQSETAVFVPVEEAEGLNESLAGRGQQPGQTNADLAQQSAARQPQAAEQNADAQQEQVEVSQARREEVSRSEELRQEAETRESRRSEEQLQEDIQLIRELAARDREVRNHEQAHMAVGGQYAGPMTLQYERGPDGKRYAVGGEVAIDVSKVPGDPQATREKAEQVRRAALAPAEPSPQDRQVAALATQIAIEAQSELRQQERMEAEEAREERSEQRELNTEVSEKTEANKADDSEKQEDLSEANEDRLEQIFERTSETIENALEAVYQLQDQQEIGFNLDTRV